MKTEIIVGRKPWSVPGFFLLVVLSFLVAGQAQAGRFINWVTLNGGSGPVTVNPGDSINVAINVTVNNNSGGGGSSNRWRCTSWLAATAPGTGTDVDHANYSSNNGTYTETFTLTAPLDPGTYNGYFIAYSDDSCSSNASSTFTMANAIVVVDNFTCTPPAGAPAGISCVCDRFNRVSLNPSTIFGANWNVSTSDGTGILPSIVGNRLRLTNNTGNNAKAATVPSIFPGAGNYLSVDFRFYAYNGTSADGIAVALSDNSIPAVPGAYGGSLGYAQQTSINGFAGGWLGVGIDEYGNFSNPTEGRVGGPGFKKNNVTVRGSGSGTTGYRHHATSVAPLNPIVDIPGATPGPGHIYRIIVDHSNGANAWVSVLRDTGSGFVTLIAPYDAKAQTGQVAVPENWKISLTGSTGGSNNIHEIDDLRICATTVWPATGALAGGFQAIDEAYGVPPRPVQQYLDGHIYTKLMGQPFKLSVGVLNNNQKQTGYAAGSSQYVQVRLVDNSDNVCVLSSSDTNYCNAACLAKTDLASQVLTYTAADKGEKQTTNFTLNTAWKRVAVILRECTNNTCTAFTSTPHACASDGFSVRPPGVSSVVSSNATNTGTSGTPIFKAGSGQFHLKATIDGIAGNPNGYTGTLKIDPKGLELPASAPEWSKGSFSPGFPAAISATPTATAEAGNFTYSEVGRFRFKGYAPPTNASATGDDTSPRGILDDTWTGVDGTAERKDCILNSFSNRKVTTGDYSSNPDYGKYGCNFGLTTDSALMGRFIPDHFALTAAQLTMRSDLPAAVPAMPPGTTGSITAGSNQLVVANASGFANGDALMVRGAGDGGSDLVASLAAAPSGNTFTLDKEAGQTVTNARVSAIDALTGSITAGASQFILTNPTGIAAGERVVVFGAGAGGANWVTTVSSLAGKVLTLAGTAATSVSGGPLGVRSGFGYIGEPMAMTVSLEARNAAKGRTLNYTGALAKLDATSPQGTAVNSWAIAGTAQRLGGGACQAVFSASAPFNTSHVGTGCTGVTPAAPYPAAAARMAVANTEQTAWINGTSTFTGNVTFGRADQPDGPFDVTAARGYFALGVWPKDSDGVTPPAANLDSDGDGAVDRVLVGVADQRYGRVALSNVFGSTSPLQMPVEAQYWTGKSWIKNTDDQATAIATGIVSSTPVTWGVAGPGTLSSGAGFITLTPPAAGRATVTADLAAMPWLKSTWNGTANSNPTATATYGIYAPEHKKTIHIREIFGK